MTFDDAFDRVIGHEGGYVNSPHDPGGETHFGISRRAYPGEDIKGMTLDRSKFLYRRDYWGPAGCDALPDALRFDVFDAAVLNGVKAAVRLLQRAIGETDDGSLGPLTLQAAQSMPALRVIARFNAARLLLMTDLPTWATFGRGWARRISDNLSKA